MEQGKLVYLGNRVAKLFSWGHAYIENPTQEQMRIARLNSQEDLKKVKKVSLKNANAIDNTQKV